MNKDEFKAAYRRIRIAARAMGNAAQGFSIPGNQTRRVGGHSPHLTTGSVVSAACYRAAQRELGRALRPSERLALRIACGGFRINVGGGLTLYERS